MSGAGGALDEAAVEEEVGGLRLFMRWSSMNCCWRAALMTAVERAVGGEGRAAELACLCRCEDEGLGLPGLLDGIC